MRSLTIGILMVLAGLSGCALDWESANRIRLRETTKPDLMGLMGEPEQVERHSLRDIYIYDDAIPAWPLVLPWVAIVYGLIYYTWDVSTLYVILEDDVVVDLYGRGPDAWKLERPNGGQAK